MKQLCFFVADMTMGTTAGGEGRERYAAPRVRTLVRWGEGTWEGTAVDVLACKQALQT